MQGKASKYAGRKRGKKTKERKKTLFSSNSKLIGKEIHLKVK